MNNEVNNAQPGVPQLNNNTAVPTTEKKYEELSRLEKEAIVGEHDIVIEEDFDINIDVSPVSSISSVTGRQAGQYGSDSGQTVQNIELPSEQSGNITF